MKSVPSNQDQNDADVEIAPIFFAFAGFITIPETEPDFTQKSNQSIQATKEAGKTTSTGEHMRSSIGREVISPMVFQADPSCHRAPLSLRIKLQMLDPLGTGAGRWEREVNCIV